MESNPIEHKDYLVMRHLMYRIVSDPSFAKRIDGLRDNFFEGNDVFIDMYTIVQQEYRKRKFSTSIVLSWLRTELAGTLDRKNADPNERGFYDYVLQDTYTVEYTVEEQREMDKTVSTFLKKVRMTNAIKKAVAKGLTDEAIDDIIKDTDRISRETAENEIPRPLNIMDAGTHAEIADNMSELTKGIQPTLSNTYNAILGGGLGRGEMGCVAGSSGFGKSLHASSLAMGYVLQGLDVVYYVLEELEPRMAHRLFKNMIGELVYHFMKQDKELSSEFIQKVASIQGTERLLREGQLHQVMKLLEEEGYQIGNLYLMKYPPYTMTVSDLRMSLIDLTVNQGINLDVMIIDYPDLMAYDNSQGESEAGGKLFASIRGIGQEFNLINWVLSQLNRTTYGTKLLTDAHLEGSYRKKNALEFLGVINQEQEEYENGFTRLYVAKSRNAKTKGEIAQFKVDSKLGYLRDLTRLERIKHDRLLEEIDMDGTREGRERQSAPPKTPATPPKNPTVAPPQPKVETDVPKVADLPAPPPMPPKPQ